MRRNPLTRTVAAGAVATLAAFALAGPSQARPADDDPSTPVVVNKVGHEVDEHAAKGQATAAAARAKHADETDDETQVPETETEEPVEEPANGQAGEDHGQAAEDHGPADERGDEVRGQDAEDHGKAGEEHGKPATDD